MIEFTSRQLWSFVLVARHRSFSRAAETLFITPSALSVSIRQLESQLGFRLFDRTTRHVALTSHGQEFLTVAQKNLEQIDAAVSRIGQSATKASQSLSLGATPEVAADILPQAIREFRGHRPELRIQLFEGDPPTIMERVQAGNLDMGLGAFIRPPTGIRRTPFFRFFLMFRCSVLDVSLVVECGRPFFRSHAQGDSQAIEDRTSVRYGLTASHRRHNGTRCSVSD